MQSPNNGGRQSSNCTSLSPNGSSKTGNGLHIIKFLWQRPQGVLKQITPLHRLFLGLYKLKVRPHCRKQNLNNAVNMEKLSWCLYGVVVLNLSSFNIVVIPNHKVIFIVMS